MSLVTRCRYDTNPRVSDFASAKRKAGDLSRKPGFAIGALVVGGVVLGGAILLSRDASARTSGNGSSNGSIRFDASGLGLQAMPEDFDKYSKTPRDVSQVDTILVHQTDVRGGFDLSDEQLEAGGGDPALARALRYRNTSYHSLYSPQDRYAWIQWPAWARTWHGDGANKYSVGFAVDGKFPGDKLDVEGTREAFRRTVRAFRSAGAPIKYVEAHRQHDDARAGDPGQEIWSKIVVPTLRELNLQERPTHTTGDGLVIPDYWEHP